MDNKEQMLNALEELKRYSQSAVVHSLSDDTIRIALKVLEKEIPNKPIVNGQYINCGVCNNILRNKTSVYAYSPYCNFCGQKIDWGDFNGRI